jgi:hypothetical protein
MSEDTSAFPLHLHGDWGKGMTLRDYFAAAALQGLCHGWEYCDLLDMSNKTMKPVAIPRAAYVIADAMLAARKEGA